MRSLDAEKRLWRQRLREIRGHIEDRTEKEERMRRALEEWPLFREASVLMLYSAIGSEPSTEGLIWAALRLGKTVCLPRVCGEDLQAVPIAENTRYILSPYGVREPEGPTLAPDMLDMILCPGLGFSPEGGRLGYGKGYYDRFLPLTSAVTVGLAFTDCVCEGLPVAARDVPLRFLLTEKGIRETLPNKGG